jgi:thiamine kinase-like enzyme
VACIHRDIHVDNLLFGDPDQQPAFRIVDWQTVGKGRAVSDVGYFLISSLPIEDRRQHESRLLRLYHDLLLQAGVQDYSFDDCWLDYRLSALAKLFITVQMTVVVDNTSDHRREWRQTDLDRLTAFISDHAVDQVV